MISTIQTFFHRHLTVRPAIRHFKNANYGSVLKSVKAPITNGTDSSVTLNLFRLIALKETGSEAWAEELATLNTAKWLDHLGQDERNYLHVYMMDRLFGDIDISPYIRLIHVPDATRAIFPIDLQDPKFVRFFRSHSRPKKPGQKIGLYGFHAKHLSVPKTIRFYGNFYNNRLFCLGKGSSFFW